MRLVFGDIVVVDNDCIGVVVKCWKKFPHEYSYDVYVRSDDVIKTYKEKDIERYMVRHKYLSEEEKKYQYYVINDVD